jgi:hypothetical protein
MSIQIDVYIGGGGGCDLLRIATHHYQHALHRATFQGNCALDRKCHFPALERIVC